jgi:SAM-dependent methyltransferase
MIAVLKPWIQGSTLDVGCWNGEVAKRLDHSPIVGIDVAVPPDCQIEAKTYDGLHIPFADQSFDTVLCSFVLHHSDDPAALLKEMARVGRRLVILEDRFDRFGHKVAVTILHQIMAWTLKMPYKLRGFRSRERWQQLFAELGLRVVSFEKHKSFLPRVPYLGHYLFVLEKERLG